MKVTLKDIAEIVNVSISTVSRVLNEEPSFIQDETHLRIIQVAEDLGYRRLKKIEQKNRKISEKQIGIVLNKMKDKYQDPYFSEVIYGIERELLDQGYVLKFTYDSQDLENVNFKEERQEGEFGVLCIGPMDNQLIERISKDVPYVLSVGGAPELDIDYVTVNFQKSAKLGVQHLLNLEHREIAFIGGGSVGSGIAMEYEPRYIGYMEALSSAGLSLFPEFIGNGFFTIRGGYQAMISILSQGKKPTALFTASDQMAFGAYKAIQEHGLSIPDDIAVVSFDDIEMSQFVHPPLTTVRVHKEELGRIGVKMLIQRMEEQLHLPLTSYLSTKLIIRESCGSKLDQIERGDGKQVYGNERTTGFR